MRPKLTIGMSTFEDFHGVFFTIQALRLYHDLRQVELLVVDTGTGPTSEMVERIIAAAGPGTAGARYVHAPESAGTQPSRDRLFREATGEAVMSLDCHVLLIPGAVQRLLAWFDAHPGSGDLLTGPMLMDDLRAFSSIYQDFWRGGNWGIWGNAWEAPDGLRFSVQEENGRAVYVKLGMGREIVTQELTAAPAKFAQHEAGLLANGYKLLGKDPEDEFEIPGMGVGLFACRKDAWLGFHPLATQFGADELYIHEKFRKAGRKCLSLGFLKWLHRFGRPEGPLYPRSNYAKVRNYVLEFKELGRDLDDVYRHFVLDDKSMSQAEWDWLIADPENRTHAKGMASMPINGLPVEVPMIFRGMQKARGRDLNEHMDAIKELAAKCESAIDLGKRRESMVALAASGCASVLSLNTQADDDSYKAVARMSPQVTVQAFSLADPLPDLPPADLLFIDTQHTYSRLSAELAKYAPNVGRYIVLHDTVTSGLRGDDGELAPDGSTRGLAHAVRDFLEANPEWFIAQHTNQQHGLTTLSRNPSDKPPGEIRIWPKGYGPGTELVQLIESLGIHAPPNCSCKKTARMMDEIGPDGCRRDREKIIQALEANYAKMGLGEKLANYARGGIKSLFNGLAWKINPTDQFGSLVDEAIRRAEDKEAKDVQKAA